MNKKINMPLSQYHIYIYPKGLSSVRIRYLNSSCALMIIQYFDYCAFYEAYMNACVCTFY